MAEKRYSLTRALANADTHGSPEWESHYSLARENEAWQSKFSISSATRGGQRVLNIPWGALKRRKSKLQKRSATRDLQTTTQSQGAFTVGSDVVGGIQSSLRPTSLLMRLPITVMTGLQGSAVLPRISTGNVPSNVNEIAPFNSADVAFGASNDGPRRMSANIVFSRQLLNQSADQIDQVLSLELCRAISFQIDSLLLNGTGINAQPLGVLNQTVTSQVTYTAAGGWGQTMAVQKQLEDNAIDATSAFWLLSTNTARVWRTTLRTGNSARYILDQSSRVNDIDAYATSFIPGSSDQSILGDWSQLVLGIFGAGLEVIYDPYTKASTGEIVLTASIYYNGFIRRPQAFVVSTNPGSIFTS